MCNMNGPATGYGLDDGGVGVPRSRKREFIHLYTYSPILLHDIVLS
jgi:hypothetical protein